MDMHLVVVRSFGDFARGDIVTDAVRITEILNSEHASLGRARRLADNQGSLNQMPIVQQGSINTTALVVPDLYVQIVPPQNLVLNGVPTNVVGVVGTASWGPVGHPVIVATMADYAQGFGPVMARKYDMGTQLATAVQQGAQSFRCVRVTDNTDSAAQAVLPGTTVTFTALHTGSLGNRVVLALTTGSRATTWRLTISLPGLQPEVYDNIAGTGALFWISFGRCRKSGPGPTTRAFAIHRRQRRWRNYRAERFLRRAWLYICRLGWRCRCHGVKARRCRYPTALWHVRASWPRLRHCHVG